ncbi:MAG: hypothetical protein ACO3EH_00520 [Ilumatobacteraceae bacterium]
MALIKSFRDVPPGGWRYLQPETSVQFTSDTFEGLVAQIIPHRKYKGIPFDTVELDVQRQLCLGLGLDHCQPEPGEDYRPVVDLTARLTTAMALSVGKTLVAALAEVTSGKVPLETKEEAQLRAAVCRGCPFNKPASLCSCSAVYKAIEAAVPQDRIQHGISVCAVCGCSLQAKVNLPFAIATAGNSSETVFPPYCWQNPGTTLQRHLTGDTTI